MRINKTLPTNHGKICLTNYKYDYFHFSCKVTALDTHPGDSILWNFKKLQLRNDHDRGSAFSLKTDIAGSCRG